MIYILVPTYARVEETKKFLGSIQDSIKQEYLVSYAAIAQSIKIKS